MSQPIGEEFGFEPRRPELYQTVLPPIDSRDLVSDVKYNDPSAGEFSGVGGLIQPTPHVPTSSERLMMVYAIDPTDDGTRPDSVAPPELDGSFNSEY
jgi:hypothetical protein